MANCHGRRLGRDRGCRNIPFTAVASEHLPNGRRANVSIGTMRNPAQASSPRAFEPLQFSHGNIWTCRISTDALVHDAQPNNCIDCRASWGLDHWLNHLAPSEDVESCDTVACYRIDCRLVLVSTGTACGQSSRQRGISHEQRIFGTVS